ncbi:MAG TPA: superoxide dismutase family protein [Candidatus Limnocylindrales bacterium]|nr:superoxide dismutase family protein [Candidatus Limnocylindrales bacterium]
MRHLRALTVAGAAALVAGSVAGGAAAEPAIHASATLVDTGGTPVGRARLVEDATGTVHVNVHVAGLSPGLHGIHLHAVGTCTTGTTPAFSSAGSHHNPTGSKHGLENPGGPHAGDLPNLVVNVAGVGRLATTTDRATLSAGATTLFDANGSALVIHAATDDQQSDPTGNSGGRVACGVLQAG